MTVKHGVSRLDVLVVQVTPQGGHEVRFLIDGEDSLQPEHGSSGWDPDLILSEDLPLLPRQHPRRVAIYNCGCGTSGCGNTTPEISRVNGAVIWRDFRTFTGVFTGPDSVEDDIDRWRLDGVIAHEPIETTVLDGDGGQYASRALDLQDLRFDEDQYASEIERATLDRSWEASESRPWHVVRRLREQIASDPVWHGTPVGHVSGPRPIGMEAPRSS